MNNAMIVTCWHCDDVSLSSRQDMMKGFVSIQAVLPKYNSLDAMAVRTSLINMAVGDSKSSLIVVPLEF